MVSFKTWKDNYLFIDEFCNYSCLNCYHNHTSKVEDEFDVDMKDDDKSYAQILCGVTLTLKRLDDEYPVCSEWASKDGSMKFSDCIDEPIWNFDEETVDKIESLSGRVSFNEIMEAIKNE